MQGITAGLRDGDGLVIEVRPPQPFPADWSERLIRLRAYILVAAEGQQRADDLFGLKLTHYRSEWSRLLPLAQQAAREAALPPGALPPGGGSALVVAIERG